MAENEIRVRHFELLDGHMPGRVQFVLSDHRDVEEADVWIEAKLPVAKAKNEQLSLVIREALVEMSRAIKSGIQDIDKEPG